MKKKSGMNEQSLQVLACAVAVAVMILLLSGDMLISQFITVNPNQEYSKEKENVDSSKESDSTENVSSSEIDKTETSSLNDYDTSFLKEVSLIDAVAKIKEGGFVVVFSGRSTCPPCRRFLPVLTTALKDLNYDTALYLDRNKIDAMTAGYEEFLSLSTTLGNEFTGTPFLMFFKDGMLVDFISGMMSEESDLQELIINKITSLK